MQVQNVGNSQQVTQYLQVKHIIQLYLNAHHAQYGGNTVYIIQCNQYIYIILIKRSVAIIDIFIYISYYSLFPYSSSTVVCRYRLVFIFLTDVVIDRGHKYYPAGNLYTIGNYTYILIIYTYTYSIINIIVYYSILCKIGAIKIKLCEL